MLDHDPIRYGGLLNCRCGGKPVQGWMAPPEVHYVHCPDCGDWAQADNEDAARLSWNKVAGSKAASVLAAPAARSRAASAR